MEKNSSNSSARGGNTKPLAQISPAKHWCFTLNNHTESDIKKLLEKFSSNSSRKYLFQEEKESTPHLQGFVSFESKKRPKGLVGINRIHWEKMRGTIQENVKYCSDPEKRHGEIWYKGYLPISKIKLITPNKKWQKEILEIIKKEPDDRTIHYYWESEGNVGKTQFSKYLVVEKMALVLSGKSSDMKYGIVKFMEKNGGFPRLIVVDIPRSRQDYVSWSTIEEIKNGMFFSGKYESDMIVGNSPHLIIFSNHQPDLELLSSDRWDIHQINYQ